MWAVGMIFAELMLRCPFVAGDSDMNQLSKIFHALGTPTEASWPGLTQLPDYVPYDIFPPTPLQQIFQAASFDELDLLSKMIVFDPLARISATEALKHPWFSKSPAATAPADLPVPRKMHDIRQAKQQVLRPPAESVTPLKRRLDLEW
eukprot:TRINITY_DN4448_c0_g1_i1.p2 TRINITY_DN4448_c0_g1~~TRINITY_DN4448_c0_g1_i1.p2  ORF type:complete len:148 (+),score=30.36 TRINITY_DN4448_c0_g1_i1:656-1099(+)